MQKIPKSDWISWGNWNNWRHNQWANSWLNLLFGIPKTNGDSKIKLRIDVKNANTNISYTRFSTPTIEDLTVKFCNATKFDKLDLSSAFYELKLDEIVHYITTF